MSGQDARSAAYTPPECKCGDLIAEEVKSLTINVDAKYLTSSNFVSAEKSGRARCPVHGVKK